MEAVYARFRGKTLAEWAEVARPKTKAERLRLWIAFAAEILLPLYCLYAWLAPAAQASDAVLFLLVGENAVLVLAILSAEARWTDHQKVFMWMLSIGVTAFAGIAVLLGGPGGLGLAMLLIAARASGVVWRSPEPHEFPATGHQAFAALAIFWGLLWGMYFAGRGGLLVLDGGGNPAGALGALYFGIVLAIRAVRLARGVTVADAW